MTQQRRSSLLLLTLLSSRLEGIHSFTTTYNKINGRRSSTVLWNDKKVSGEPFTFFSLFNKEDNPALKTDPKTPEQTAKTSEKTDEISSEKTDKKTPKFVKSVDHPAHIPHISPLNNLHPSLAQNLPKDAKHLIENYHLRNTDNNSVNVDLLDESLLPVNPAIVRVLLLSFICIYLYLFIYINIVFGFIYFSPNFACVSPNFSLVHPIFLLN